MLERNLNISDPKERADLLRVRSQRIFRVAQNVIEKHSHIEEPKLIQLRDLDKKCLDAQTAAKIAADKFNDSGIFLPGTGGDAWKVLFDAARKFSEEAYPGNPFPYIETGAKCPLCQQILDIGAIHLQHFEEYIQQEIETIAQTRRKELNEMINAFVNKNMAPALDEEILSEIGFYDEILSQDCRTFEKALDDRFEKMVAAFSSHDWKNVPDLPINPLERLESLAVYIKKESEVLDNAADEELRKRIQLQYNELDTRIHLSQRKSAVLIAVNRMKYQANLLECLPAVKTNSISLKKSEIAEKIISEKLANTLNDEFSKLDVGDLKVLLTSRTEKGKTLYKLKLDLHHIGNPGEILSEGEQRAIAIGSFLAEVGINDESGGIIFDDPVSSLDHRSRERVAKRLAQEAEKRQVIIFTHDIYFLCLLMEEAEMAGVNLMTQSLIKSHHKYGVVEADLPFEGKNTKARIILLKQLQQEIVNLNKAGEEQECRKKIVDAYRMLRYTWERSVEEVLFRKVVLRFRKGVATQMLKEVEVEDSDYEKIFQGMTRCSNYSHDKALIPE